MMISTSSKIFPKSGEANALAHPSGRPWSKLIDCADKFAMSKKRLL